MWNENISCHINQQEMSQPSAISGLQMWMGAPQTSIQRMLPPLIVTAEELGECKKQDEQGDRIGKEWSQWTQRLASPCRQKAKFLNLIPHLWCSDCLLPLFQTYIAWRSPCLLGAVSSKLLRCCLPGSESSTFPLNEITLCFQVVTTLFCWHWHALKWVQKQALLVSFCRKEVSNT